MFSNLLHGSILARELSQIDLSAPSFGKALFFAFFNPLFWNVLGRREYRHRTLSNLFGGNSTIACYALAACIFGLGLYRDYLYASAHIKRDKSTLMANTAVDLLWQSKTRDLPFYLVVGFQKFWPPFCLPQDTCT